jgi:hypothetical protein
MRQRLLPRRATHRSSPYPDRDEMKFHQSAGRDNIGVYTE